MQRHKQKTPKDNARPTGDRHSLTQQFFGEVLCAVREGNEIQTMINRFRHW